MHNPSIFELNPRPVAALNAVSRTLFDQEIRHAAQPVILRGLVKDWPAVAAAQRGPEQVADHLRSLDVGANVVPFRALLDKLL